MSPGDLRRHIIGGLTLLEQLQQFGKLHLQISIFAKSKPQMSSGKKKASPTVSYLELAN